MTNSSWNPPTGPPNGAAIPPADARREIDEALEAAHARDRELRAEVVAVVTARVMVSERFAAATQQVAETRSLAERALTRSNDSARAGQRADAAKWTAAAQVFAMRLRDARDQVAALELQLATVAEQAQRVETAFARNVGWLEAVVAARLPMLSGRKASRAHRSVDEVIAVISAPIGDLVAQARQDARAALANEGAAEGDAEVAPVADDDLEREVDVESTDAILDELRTELGLPAPTDSGPNNPGEPRTPRIAAGSGETVRTPDTASRPQFAGPVRTTGPGAGAGSSTPVGPAPAGEDRVASPPGGSPGPASGSPTAVAPAGTPAPTRSWPVPATRR